MEYLRTYSRHPLKHLFSCVIGLSIFCFLPLIALAQSGIKGTVTTTSNTPLPFASITVYQSSTGTVANADGYFELPLSAGQYEIDFQFMGYAKVRKKIVIKDSWITLDVSLNEQVIQLESAHVGKQSEDPAYTVMRRAIAKARFHELQIRQFSAQAYTRTTGTFTSIPFLVKKRLKQEGIVENQDFLNESVTELHYERPNKYQQRVVSTRNSLDNTIPTPNQFVMASFYSPTIQGTTSPLSPRAFSVYKFEYEGFFEDQGFVINKIKVIPKSYGQGLVKGTLYIVEDMWAIHSFDLQTTSQGFTIGLKQTSSYRQDAWIPMSQQFQLRGKFMGFAGHMRYLVSLKYKHLDIDPALKENITIRDHQKEEVAKEKQTSSLSERIEQQQAFSTKDFRKLVKEFEKEDRKTRKAQGDNTRIVRSDSLSVDSLAHQRDTTYWQAIRPIPLTPSEIKSYVQLDSIQVVRDSLRVTNNSRNDSVRFHASHLLTGARYKLPHQQKITYKGPLQSVQYNTVDGLAMDVYLLWQKTIQSELHFGLESMGRYALHRHQLNGTLGGFLTYKQANFQLEGGRNTFQINEQNPVSTLLNSMTTLFFEQNDLKLFDKRYIKGTYRQALLEQSFHLSASFEHGTRIELFNLAQPWKVIDWTSRAFSPNLPFIQELGDAVPLLNSTATIASLQIHYRPWRQFIERNGKKYALPNRSPEFTVHFKQAIPFTEKAPNYQFLELHARTHWKVTPQSTFRIAFNTGKFFTKSQLPLVDYKHWMSNYFFVQLPHSDESFRLLPLYQFSTQKQFFQSHLIWNSKHFLLGQIPLVRMIGLQESLHHHYLKTPSSPHYQEYIYGIEGIFRLLKIEFVTQFHNFTYQGAGFRLGTIINLRN